MLWEQAVQYASLSDIGFRRQNNQDACVVQICADQETWERSGHLFIVADGMGGHAAGELASKIAVDTIPITFFKSQQDDLGEAIKKSVEIANAKIHERGTLNRDFNRMGTTCSALVLSPSGAVVGHVGDSRVYRIRNEHIEQLTFDHSLQWELLRQGAMNPEDVMLHQPRNVITRSLGPEPSVKVDTEGPHPIEPGDTYVLCSDGLTGHLNDAEIGAIAREMPPKQACRLLVNLANLRGGSDNITVVIARVGAPSATSPVEKDETGLSWWSVLGLWSIGITFGVGLSAALLEQRALGITLISLSAVIAAGLLVRWWIRRPKTGPLASQTICQGEGPYRRASARLTRKFLIGLSAAESELQATASEEGWQIDWEKHGRVYENAKTLLANRQYAQAFREFAVALEILIGGLQEQRRQAHHEQRWGNRNKTGAG